ncbi:MBL fold metallo-hydrolase [Luteitalea sp. TBR-22]|uniref:MBL fold metallo-hydrolase n=1 Tax=Luteitalea sp. TBR-22 TaxID=2802971 RepID=UPI001AF811A9|nr:MBL fold metallo-hydrolase [Luteitalea sp. TBR-22]BCS32635.1 MBL fold metallo-hydrolase [Luteitalea sp. TBR-22]
MLTRYDTLAAYIAASFGLCALGAFGLNAAVGSAGAPTAGASARPGTAGVAYPNMPALAPIGVRMDRYQEVPREARGAPIDPAKGYRLQQLGEGLFMVTDGAYQSMFLVYEAGVVVVDAPPSYAARIRSAIAEVTDQPITHVVYSHHHVDHIAGVRQLGGTPIIIAHEETNRLLARDKDPDRPLASVTFRDRYTVRAGTQRLELTYHGVAHAPGNIFIHAPRQRTLMVVDVVFPGWMPWRRFAVAHDVPNVFQQVEEISRWDFDTLVGGHVARTGTRDDVLTQLAFMKDLKAAAGAALEATVPGEGLHEADRAENPWARFDHYIDRVALACVNELTPKWASRLAAFDVYVWDQCFTMEQSLRID